MQINCQNPKYLGAALSPDQYPNKLKLPEIAIVGRSNVGKSSLINHLFKNKGLAKVSSTPGKTRLLQFFSIEDKVVFVDLPGYGYAKNPDASWDDVISTYLKNSPHLKILLLLIDSRHPPTALDLQMMEWIEAMHIRCIVVLTKCDKLTLSQCQTQTKMILNTLSPAEPLPFVNYSIESGDGRKKLLTLIGQSL